MKKILFILIVLFISIFTINVYAISMPYSWYSNEGGYKLSKGATEEMSSDGKTLILKLNNYNGKGLHLESRGTGVEKINFVIELTGDNVIVDDGIGLDFNYDGKIKFKGDGSLTIKAAKPISYEEYKDNMIIIPSENIYTDNLAATSKATGEAKSSKKDNNSFIFYVVVGLITGGIASVLIRILKKKNV